MVATFRIFTVYCFISRFIKTQFRLEYVIIELLRLKRHFTASFISLINIIKQLDNIIFNLLIYEYFKKRKEDSITLNFTVLISIIITIVSKESLKERNSYSQD